MFKKLDFELIVIPSSVSDEADFTVIAPIYNACEPVYPKIMNWNLSGFAFIELYTKHSYTFSISCIPLENMLSNSYPQNKGYCHQQSYKFHILLRKITNW